MAAPTRLWLWFGVFALSIAAAAWSSAAVALTSGGAAFELAAAVAPVRPALDRGRQPRGR